jgi:hypothetical protein
LKVENELSSDVDVKALRRKVETLAAEIKQLQASEIVRKEGGSGLHKVAKILRIDCGCEFSFAPKVEKGQFSVLIDLTPGRLLV